MSILTERPDGDIWLSTLAELENQLPSHTFHQHIRDCQLVSLEDGQAVIHTPKQHSLEWLNVQLKKPIATTLSSVYGRYVQVTFQLAENSASAPPEESSAPAPPDQEETRGRKVKLPLSDAQGNHLRPNQAYIEIVKRDPMRAHLQTPHYAKRFWQPFLGLIPFTLWEVLRSYYFFVKQYNADWPTISLLVDTMGYGDRVTLLGRKASAKKKAQQGAVHILEENGLCVHRTIGEGRQTVHYFTRLVEDLPILTPAQVDKLPPRKQAEHAQYLGYYEFDIEAWNKISIPSFLLED